MKRIGVFTSGGDSPGMNAAVRAVVRTCMHHNIVPFGIYEGYKGLIEGNIKQLSSRDVSNIIQRGGTFLRSARCKEFFEKEGRQKAFDNIKKFNLDGIVAIGGDGTFTGAKIFNEEHQIPFIGIPGTIDNDLFGTDYCIGYDTALNTVVEAVDKIRDTASSHNRLFIVEVMGRDAGLIALRSGIGVGAEAILIPETPTYIDKLIGKLKAMRRNLVAKHLAGIYTDDVFIEQNTLLSKNINRLQKSVNTNSIKSYKLDICLDYVTARTDDLDYAYSHLDTDNKKAFLSTIFPLGLIWNYPGLTYSVINPLFEV